MVIRYAILAGRRGLVAAALLRSADEGLPAALVLLAASHEAGTSLAGLLVAAVLVPQVLSGIGAGALLDRSADPRLLVAGAAATLCGAIAAEAALVGRSAVAALAVAAVAGVVAPFVTGGLSAVIQGQAHGGVERLQALDAATYGVGAIVGPAVAAAALGVAPAGPALAMAGIALAGASALALMPPPTPPRGAIPDRVPEHRVVRAPFTGVRELFRDPELRDVTVASTIGALGYGALPIAAIELGQAHATSGAGSLLLSVAGAAALAAAGVAPRMLRRAAANRVVAKAMLLSAAAFMVGATAPTLALAAAAFAAAGAADGIVLPAVFAARTQHAARHRLAAAFTAAASLKITAAGAGAAGAGVLAPAAGPAGLLALIAAVQVMGLALGRISATGHAFRGRSGEPRRLQRSRRPPASGRP